ncbi:DUF4249 family protein [Chitinophaga tropicalis]|uniref:DUF4249 family protein n=1 Tax=Chitinophaga tropicalis TaxID=2683588 RepID=A0A7K1U3L7_9BACT|nr:DUF4249 family protein [Chitinophaga tropicalis]MVT08962.1 DUF4249 family protein [Chitinophaga tropicalis]
MKFWPIVFLLLIVACREKTDFQFPGDRGFAIEGLLTNKDTTQWVRITEVSGNLYNDGITGIHPERVVKGVANARVYIIESDIRGEISIINLHLDSSRYDTRPGVGGRDTVYFGYYIVEHFKGTPGRTYTLTIDIDSTWAGPASFTASEVLKEAPEIDSITGRYATVFQDNAWNYYFHPRVYFRDIPWQKDYYMLRNEDEEDQLLVVDDSYAASGRAFSPELPSNKRVGTSNSVNVTVSIYNISKGAFTFHKAIADQQQSDGGVFRPLSYLPAGNITERNEERGIKRLGYFMVAGVKTITRRVVVNN